jgi:hypothetical protein
MKQQLSVVPVEDARAEANVLGTASRPLTECFAARVQGRSETGMFAAKQGSCTHSHTLTGCALAAGWAPGHGLERRVGLGELRCSVGSERARMRGKRRRGRVVLPALCLEQQQGRAGTGTGTGTGSAQRFGTLSGTGGRRGRLPTCACSERGRSSGRWQALLLSMGRAFVAA